jgi:hypothetical protein
MKPAPAADALEARVIEALRHTRGTMPIAIVVPDEATRERGLAILGGRKHAKLIVIVTEAELRARQG